MEEIADQPSRPYDFLGPPSDPICFPQARYHHGKRADVLCYNPETDKYEKVKNVLFRDYSRSAASGHGDEAGECVTEAYWRIPDKKPVKTIMGHIDFCVVLERFQREEGNNEDEMVFQWTKQRVAIKVNYCERMDRLRNRLVEDPLKEVSAMQLIGYNHPNVLGCREVLLDGRNLDVIMRFCDSGDLFELLLQESQSQSDSPGPGLSEGQARYWFRQIMPGVQHLHSVGICHRDLTPENVMIDDNRIAFIIAMDMCLRVPYLVDSNTADEVTDIQNASKLAAAQGGTPVRCLFKPQGARGKLSHMAPEIYENRTSFDGAAIDVWSAGTILFCMLTGSSSYQRPHETDAQFCWMTRGLPELLSNWRINLTPEGLHLLQNMLQVDPRLRLTLDEVANHPWFSLPDEPP